MRRLWIIMAVVLAFGGLAVFATGAGAASKPSAKFCKALDKIGSSNQNDLPFGEQASAMARQFDKAAKSAPNKKTKTAMTQLGDFFDELGDIDNVAGLASVYSGKGMTNYIKNIGTFADVSVQCSLNS